MSSVNEQLVRAYLEELGFFVMQPRTHVPAGRIRRPEEDMDLLAYNPKARSSTPPPGAVWSSEDVARTPRILVSVRGWHTERFGPSLLENSPELFRFVACEVRARAERMLGGSVSCVMCVPGLPASRALRQQALDILRARGVSGVLPFRTLLIELAGRVDVSRNYDRSDIRQTLRILKAHGLLGGAQLPLFGVRRPRRGGRGKASVPEADA